MICQEIIGRKTVHHRKYIVFKNNCVFLRNYILKSLFWTDFNASNTPFLLTSNLFFANISMLYVNDNGNDNGNVNKNGDRSCSKISRSENR